VVHEITDLETRVGEGPDLTILDGQPSITVADTCDEKRWPTWAPAVTERGVRSLMSVRLSTRERVFGSITVYSRRPFAFAEDHRAVMLALARHAASPGRAGVRRPAALLPAPQHEVARRRPARGR